MVESLLIAIAMCVDAFGLGVAYGIKKIKIPKYSIIVINIITIAILGCSMFLGGLIKQYISPSLASTISCTILICLGLFFIVEGYLKYLADNKSDSDNNLVKIRLPRLGIIIDIALDFTRADMDISGDISIKEAVFLGMTLSIDSLAAGFGIALGNTNHFVFLGMVFCMNIISILSGLLLGKKLDNNKSNLKTSLLPGCIIFFIGILRWI